MKRRLHSGIAALLAAALLGSCAYYNTYYLAKKYYDKGTEGAPYPLEKATGTSVQNFTKAIDYSKKVIAQYPRSKWVDDAYLLWACALLGREDPLETINMLHDYELRYPKSPVRNEAQFYLGVAYRQAHKYNEAVVALDEFLKRAPKHSLAPYAYLERGRALMSLERYADAADAADRLIRQFPHSKLREAALQARAEAFYKQGNYDRARADYRELGVAARNDDDRFGFLMKETDCLESARQYDTAITMLRDAMSHEIPPAPQPVIPVTPPGQQQSAIVTQPQVNIGPTRFGDLEVRTGTVNLLAGRLDKALEWYRNAIRDYPHSPVAAEAQYRIGYAYETVGDDFERARAEYAHVKDQFGSGAFPNLANTRLANLESVSQAKGAVGDTLAKQAEKKFLLAELYLFQLDKPERALEEYRSVADSLKGTPYAAKALTAEAWVLGRKLKRPAEAESLWWQVVHEYPATDAQLAARDYLELGGQTVPSELIKAPIKPVAPPDTGRALTPPPGRTPRLGETDLEAEGDTSHVLRPPGLRGRPPGMRTPRDENPFAPGDTTRHFRQPRPPPFVPTPPDTTGPNTTPPDSTRRMGPPFAPPAPPDTTRSSTHAPPAPPDSTRSSGPPPFTPAPPDTTHPH